ncbi:hypothetical protein [Burkholderia pseudomultivorans]|uniref:hypothetical protein n=1 Tax=Burkholderia pseudomultivorans TaxID=1207504 RepID=UPI001E335689|nr:hypothetical protein [Burkholderia pseudomultivorans]
MSELVQIAPGGVFSSDMLDVEWSRKYRPDDGNTWPVTEIDQEAGTSEPAQLSLL